MNLIARLPFRRDAVLLLVLGNSMRISPILIDISKSNVQNRTASMALQQVGTDQAQHTLILPPSGSNMMPFYNNQELSDCEICTEGKVHKCHRLVLSAASAAFRAMFASSEMLEASSGRVVVKDTAPEVMEKLLQHMYGLEVQVPIEQVVALYQLADQYQVKSARRQLQKVVSGATFQLEELTTLMPQAAALGDTATKLRVTLAEHAVQQIAGIMQQPRCVRQWGSQELVLVMRSISPHQALLLAAAWMAGDDGRLQHWGELKNLVKPERIPFAELKQLRDAADVLALPGMASVLFTECIRRMENSINGHYGRYINAAMFG